jgi:thiol-disulfide isomerase/thioredoxin
MRWLALLTFSVLCSVSLALAKSSASNDCLPSAEVDHTLQQLDITEDLPYYKLHAKQKAILENSLKKHPDDIFLNRRYQDLQKNNNAERAAMLQKYQAHGTAYPHSPTYQYLYARSLVGVDTAKAIELYQRQHAMNKNYPWIYLGLASAQYRGNFADKDAAHRDVIGFFEFCPASHDESALYLLRNLATPSEAGKYAAALRSSITTDGDSGHLYLWPSLWDLEFKAVAITEHNKVRKRLTKDLQALEQSGSALDEQKLSVLKQGYEMLGDEAGKKQIEAEWMERYPHSPEVRWMLDAHWNETHPAPKPDDPDEKQETYFQSELQHINDQLKQAPEDFTLLTTRLNSLEYVDNVSSSQVSVAADEILAAAKHELDYYPPIPVEFQVAHLFVDKQMRIAEVPSLIERGWQSKIQHAISSDQESEEYKTIKATQERHAQVYAATVLAGTAIQLGNPKIAKSAVDDAEKALGGNDDFRSSLYKMKAKYAEAEGRKLDALLLYQAALEARPAESCVSHKDDLMESEARLWKELGGTPDTRDLWQKQGRKTAAKASIWQKPTKELPPWELPDLQGKTWKMLSLRGKTVFINVWATWCGPCQAEHPHLQKLYQQVKDRVDVQVVTLNMDDEIGKVAPYMKEKGYTFPVLLARTYIDDVTPSAGIPQNWVVDAHGKWIWEQSGFGDEEKWQESVLEKLEPADSQP